VLLEKTRFALGRFACTQNSNDFLLTLGENHHDHASLNWPNSYKAIFVVTMSFIYDFLELSPAGEQRRSLPKRDAVLGLIGRFLHRVPFEEHARG
jgi:hypothetical protein